MERRPPWTPESELGAELDFQINTLKASLLAVTKLRSRMLGEPVDDSLEVVIRPRRPIHINEARARKLQRDLR